MRRTGARGLLVAATAVLACALGSGTPAALASSSTGFAAGGAATAGVATGAGTTGAGTTGAGTTGAGTAGGATGVEPSVCPSDWSPELPVGDQKGSDGACADHRGFGLDGLIWWGPDWGIPPLGTHVDVPATPFPDPARPLSRPLLTT